MEAVTKQCQMMLKTISILFFLSLNLSSVFCQDVIVQIDAKKKTKPGEIIITKTDVLTGSNFFEKNIVVKPGSLSSYRFSNDVAGLFEVNGKRILVSTLADSIHVFYDDKGITLNGKYSGNYIAWTKINSVPYPHLKEQLSTRNISRYVRQLDSVYILKMKVLDSMKHTLSLDAVRYMQRHIDHGFMLSYLGKIGPANAGEISRDYTGSKFIKSISLQDFKDDNLADMTSYILAGQALASVYAIEQKKEDRFMKQVEVAVKEFNGLTRERILKMIFLNTNTIDSITPQRLDSLMPFIRQLKLSGSTMKIINNKYHVISIVNQPINKNIQQRTVFKDLKGKETTLEQLLNLYKGKTIVFDIWASWCGPCVAQIPNMKVLKARYKDLRVIYISVDMSEKAWLSAVKKLQIEDQQYLLGQDFNSVFAKHLGLGSIPRYLVVNGDGLLTHIDAPPPADLQFYDQLLK